MTKPRPRMHALCALAVSWLCACGQDRSALAPGDGAAGTTGVAGSMGIAGTTGAAGTSDGGAPDVAVGAQDANVSQTDGAPFTYASAPGCSKDGWCWSTPTPQGNSLYSISGSGASDIWAVGEIGAIVHWDGTAWAQVPSGLGTRLYGVWTSSVSDAWAVGEYDVIVRWDGKAWARPPSAPTTGCHWRAVWGTGPRDVWIVGDDPTQGAGTDGAMMHWDGDGWTRYDGPQSLGAVWGTRPDDVWGLGEDQGLYHWDGKAWTTVSERELIQVGTAIWGSSANDVWFSGRSSSRPSHWDGATLRVDGELDADLDGLWGSAANDVWAVGDVDRDFFNDRGIILHWDGLSWQRMPDTGASHLFDVWGSRSDDVWAVGQAGDIVHWNGQTWSAPVRPPRINLFSGWANDPEDVWAFGYDRTGLAALRWNGKTWSRTGIIDAAAIGASTAFATAPYRAWGSGRDDVWVSAVNWEPIGNTGSNTARSLFVHWDGQRWSLDETLDTQLAASMGIGDMWGSGPKDIWAVGSIDAGTNPTGVAVHWDGARWSPVTSLPPTDLADAFRSVWGSGPNDVWIGGTSAVHHWDGVSWSRPLQLADGYFQVGGSGPADVWAIANNGTAVASRWNGTVWQKVAFPDRLTPYDIVAISPTNAWLRGEELIGHWDGTAWTVSETGASQLTSNVLWDGKGLWMITIGGVIHRH